MPEVSRKQKLSPHVDWDGRDLFIKLLANPSPVYAIFPREKNKSCIHIKGGFDDTDKAIEQTLQRKKDNSLGVILGVAKPQPSDWGTKPEHKNSAGYLKTWGAQDKHIEYLNVFVAEGDPENMSLDDQLSCIKKAGLPVPSFTVNSGNRSLHSYWLAERVPPDKWSNIQQRIIQLLDEKCPELKADSSIKNPARVMRCVGGRHSKTNKFCQFKDFVDVSYSWEDFDKNLPPLEEKKNKSTINKTSKFTTDKGWLDRKTPEEKREYVIEMLKVIPIHRGEGKGRRLKICIPVLAGLVNEYGNEAVSICNEAGWYGDLWNPESEIEYLDQPECDLGTVVHWAREYGWVYSQNQQKSNIKIENIFPAEVANSIKTITTYLPYKDSLKILTFMHAVAPLIRLGTKINCIPTTGFIVPLNLFGCVIGDSGSKKTPLFKLLLIDPLRGVAKDINRENYLAGQQYVRDLAAYNQNGGDKPERPPYPIVYTSNATTEALEKVLMDQEKAKLGLLRFNDELAGLIKSFGAYKQGKGGDEEFLLERYDGDGFDTRRMEGNRYCGETAVSVFGGGQPAVLKKLQQGKEDNGLWARFIFDYCAAIPTKLPTAATSEDRRKFNKAKDYLSYFIQEVREFRTQDLELTDEAIVRFADYEFNRQKLSASNIKPAHKSIYNKSAGKVGRVAGILWIMHQVQEKIKNKISQGDSYVDLPPENIVDISTVNDAIELVNYWDDLSINVANKSSESSKDAILQRLLSIAGKSKGPVPFSDIYKKLSFDHRKDYTYEEITEFIEKLAELDLGTLSKGPRNGKMFKAEKQWPTG